MTAPAKLNFKIYQGSTFLETLRWESATKIYKPITGILKSAPVTITSVAHGIPVGWRVKLTNIAGMTELNSTETYHYVTGTTTDTITINSVNAVGYKDYTSGGIVEYNQPVDLTGYTARMQIREKLDSASTLYELTTTLGNITIDNTLKSITLTIPAATTAGFSFTSGVYSLELVSSSGQVTPLIAGTVTLVKEVTR